MEEGSNMSLKLPDEVNHGNEIEISLNKEKSYSSLACLSILVSTDPMK